MDIIEKLAKKSFMDNVEYGRVSVRDSVNDIKLLTYDFDSKLDKIKFLSFHIDWVSEKYQEHLKVCHDPDSCSDNENNETFLFYIQQELKSLGVKVDEDTFTFEEKNFSESKLDQILKYFEEIKLGNQIIYDDILKEIQELKDLHFLGKKKWYQLLAGKITEMTIGGVISETVSKDLISVIKPSLNNLLS
jgi:hypothetical protein